MPPLFNLSTTQLERMPQLKEKLKEQHKLQANCQQAFLLLSVRVQTTFLASDANISSAFILVFMAVFTLIMLICSIRVNVVLVVIIFGVFLGFVLVAAALFVENEAILAANAAISLTSSDPTAAEAMLASAVSKRALTLRLVTVSQSIMLRYSYSDEE